MKRRVLNLVLVLDAMIYVCLTLGNGSPFETCSSAAYRLELEGRLAGRIFRPVIDAILWFDPDHCRTSFENLRALKYLPPAYKIGP